MTLRSNATAALVAALLAAASPAEGIIVSGGGSSRTDCLSVFEADANTPPEKPRHIRIADGDPGDADGVVNGVCEFRVTVCANSTYNPACTLNGVESITVDHALDNGDPKFDPEFQALQTRIDTDLLDDPPNESPDACTGGPTTFLVPVEGPFAGNRCKKRKKTVKLTALSKLIAGRVYKDRDKIKLTCDPAPAGCDPRAFYSNTFDRIQKQIFDQSCAVSGCHDSESQTGDLLLETGSSYGNLINVTPSNSAAAGAGWKRVTLTDPDTGDPCTPDPCSPAPCPDPCSGSPCVGDLATSFLFHKVTGDLGPGFGQRMPFGQPKLDENLINVIQLWIEAGAPTMCWVPGTD